MSISRDDVRPALILIPPPIIETFKLPLSAGIVEAADCDYRVSNIEAGNVT